MTDPAPPLTDVELRKLRSLLGAITGAEWRALKALAAGIVAANGGGASAPGVSGVVPTVASDAEIDGQWGDPKVKRKDPRRWAGSSYVGAQYSQCPSDYLLILAESLEYFAAKDKDKPDAKKSEKGVYYWQYNLKDAARARAWAKRNQGKTLPPPVSAASADESSQGDPDVSNEYQQSVTNDADEEWTPS